MASATESFTGTDGADLDTLSGWTKNAAGGQVLEVQANRCASPGSNSLRAWRRVAADTVDQDVVAQYWTVSTAKSTPSVAGRLNTGSSANGYFVRYQSGTWTLHKASAGSVSSLGTYTGDDPTTERTVKLEIRDAAKKIYIGGVERVSSTDNAITAAGYMGCIGYFVDSSSGANSSYIDDWTGDDAGAPPFVDGMFFGQLF